ncbi:TPA: hypothetical protein ACF33U_004212 [Vibrio parahaemolyticus]
MRISIITLAFLMTGCFGDNQQDQEVKKAIDATVEFRKVIQKEFDLIGEHQPVVQEAKEAIELTSKSSIQWDSVVDFCLKNDIPECKQIRGLIR